MTNNMTNTQPTNTEVTSVNDSFIGNATDTQPTTTSYAQRMEMVKELRSLREGESTTTGFKKKLSKSYTVFRAKGSKKGFHYNSVGYALLESLNQFSEKLSLDIDNERDVNLYSEITFFVESLERTHPNLVNQKANLLLEGKSLLDRYFKNVVILKGVYEDQTKLSYDNFIASLSEFDPRRHLNHEAWKTSRKYAYVLDNANTEITKDLIVAKLRYKELQREYASEAKMLSSQDGVSGAYVYSILYLDKFENYSGQEATRRLRTRTGQSYVNREREVDKNGNLMYKGFSSLLDLFSDGAMATLKSIGEGKLAVPTQIKENVKISLRIPKEIGEQVKQAVIDAINNRTPIELKTDIHGVSWNGLYLNEETTLTTKKTSSATINPASHLEGVDSKTKETLATYLEKNSSFRVKGVVTQNMDLYTGYACGYYFSKLAKATDDHGLDIFITRIEGKYSEERIAAMVSSVTNYKSMYADPTIDMDYEDNFFADIAANEYIPDYVLSGMYEEEEVSPEIDFSDSNIIGNADDVQSMVYEDTYFDDLGASDSNSMQQQDFVDYVTIDEEDRIPNEMEWLGSYEEDQLVYAQVDLFDNQF